MLCIVGFIYGFTAARVSSPSLVHYSITFGRLAIVVVLAGVIEVLAYWLPLRGEVPSAPFALVAIIYSVALSWVMFSVAYAISAFFPRKV